MDNISFDASVKVIFYETIQPPRAIIRFIENHFKNVEDLNNFIKNSFEIDHFNLFSKLNLIGFDFSVRELLLFLHP